MRIGRLADYHTDSFDTEFKAYFFTTARSTGTAQQIEIFVSTPPTATTTIGLKRSIFGNLTCSTAYPPSDFPTGDFMVVDLPITDPDCYFEQGDVMIMSINGNISTTALRLGGYTDGLVMQISLPYMKISTVEPFITQDDGSLSFGLAILVFFAGMILWGMIFKVYARN